MTGFKKAATAGCFLYFQATNVWQIREPFHLSRCHSDFFELSISHKSRSRKSRFRFSIGKQVKGVCRRLSPTHIGRQRRPRIYEINRAFASFREMSKLCCARFGVWQFGSIVWFRAQKSRKSRNGGAFSALKDCVITEIQPYNRI